MKERFCYREPVQRAYRIVTTVTIDVTCFEGSKELKDVIYSLLGTVNVNFEATRLKFPVDRES